MQNEEFNKEIEQIMNGEKHLSFSALKAFMQSPKHFYTYKTDKKTTNAMEAGKLFHMAILEPMKFIDTYWVLDDSVKVMEIGGGNPRATKLYKEWVSEQDALNIGKDRISKDDYDLYLSMGAYLHQNDASKHLMNGLIEKELDFEFEHSGFKVKGKIDGKGSDYIIDLKKVADASFKKVRWIIEDMMYDMQAGIYCASNRIKRYYLIFIDNSCSVTVVKLNETTIQNGFGKFGIALDEFRRCAEEDKFNASYEFFNGGFIEV